MQRWLDFYALGGNIRAAVKVIWKMLRVPVGILMLTIGVAGFILPVIPGIPFLVVGALMLGPRTYIIRWTQVNVRLAVRRLASHDHPLLGRVGRYAWDALKEVARQVRRTVAQYRTPAGS
jgi:hypothetical protein